MAPSCHVHPSLSAQGTRGPERSPSSLSPARRKQKSKQGKRKKKAKSISRPPHHKRLYLSQPRITSSPAVKHPSVHDSQYGTTYCNKGLSSTIMHLTRAPHCFFGDTVRVRYRNQQDSHNKQRFLSVSYPSLPQSVIHIHIHIHIPSRPSWEGKEKENPRTQRRGTNPTSTDLEGRSLLLSLGPNYPQGIPPIQNLGNQEGRCRNPQNRLLGHEGMV